MVASTESKNNNNDDFSVFPKSILKVTRPKTKQSNYTEFFGYSFKNIYNRNDLPDPLDPKSSILTGFRGFSIGACSESEMVSVLVAFSDVRILVALAMIRLQSTEAMIN